MPRTTYGPTVQARGKRLLEALLSFVNEEFEESDLDIKFKWKDKDSANPKLIVKTTLADLRWLTKKDKHPGELTQEQIRKALKLLDKDNKKALLKILKDNRIQTQGVDTWDLTLTLWSKDKENNLKQFDKAWEDSKPAKSKALEANYKKSKDCTEVSQPEIDWRTICRTKLEKQKQLTTNRLMSADEMLFDINQIGVDLALVERKKPDKRSGDDNPEQSQLYKPDYEETEKLEYKDFLTKVLKSEPSKNVAIIGEPGAGKTTLLQRIAFWILENTNSLPIWIPLGILPTAAPTLKDYLLHHWLEDAIVSVTPKIKTEFEELLTAGRVWLLLDGVDEMVANFGNPLSFINNWIPGWCQHLSVVLTCRLNVWEANPYALNNFKTYRTLEFSQEKVEEFIEACFQNRRGAPTCAHELGIQLQQAINEPGKERIKDLVKNPLRLTLLCSTWHLRKGKLPDTKAELYQQFVEEVYRWKKDEFPTTPEQRKQLNAKLKELALEAIDKEENRFCLRHKFIEGILGDREDSVFQLAINIGWLNQVGVDAKNPNPNQPVYAFFHPTFQEYFAALAIDDWDFFLPRAHDNRNPKPVSDRYRIFEPQWKEVILLWLGREEVAKGQKEEFIKKWVEFQDGCGDFYTSIAYRSCFIYFNESYLNEIYTDQLIESLSDNTIKAYFYKLNNLDLHESGVILPTSIVFHFRLQLEFSDPNIFQMWILYFSRIDHAPKRSNYSSEVNIKSPKSIKKYIQQLIKYLSDNDASIRIEQYINYSIKNIKIPSSNLIGSTQPKKIKYDRLDLEKEVFNFLKIRRKYIVEIIKISYSYPALVMAALRKAIYDSQEEHTYRLFAILIEQVNPKNLEVFYVLIYLWEKSKDKLTRTIVVNRLIRTILNTNHSFIFTAFKCLQERRTIYNNNPELYNDYRLLLSYCAQNMTYPDFYQAWHQQEEVDKTTTSDSQSLNQADLPQTLHTAITNDPQLSQTIHLICIDSSQCIEPKLIYQIRCATPLELIQMYQLISILSGKPDYETR